MNLSYRFLFLLDAFRQFWIWILKKSILDKLNLIWPLWTSEFADKSPRKTKKHQLFLNLKRLSKKIIYIFKCDFSYLSDRNEVILEIKSGLKGNLSKDDILWNRLVANPIHVFKIVQRSLLFTTKCIQEVPLTLGKSYFYIFCHLDYLYFVNNNKAKWSKVLPIIEEIALLALNVLVYLKMQCNMHI